MTKLDLITGFLGSGKTTFIKNYVEYLKSKGENVCIIENDFGAINVDLLLASSLDVDTEMIIGGSDLDCHKRRFKTKLISLIHKHYDRIIIEPSGVYDTDEFFDTVYEDVIYDNYEIGNVFCIYDINTKNLSEEDAYIFVSESANASKIIVTKRDNLDKKVDLDYINQLHKKFQSSRTFTTNDIVYNDNLNFDFIINAGYKSADHIKKQVISKNDYETLYILDKDIKLSDIDKIKDEIFCEKYGGIYRVKGFIYDDIYYAINLTKNEKKIEPIKNGQKVIIIIGKNLKKELIENIFSFTNNNSKS